MVANFAVLPVTQLNYLRLTDMMYRSVFYIVKPNLGVFISLVALGGICNSTSPLSRYAVLLDRLSPLGG